jgi:diacylglycerol O-acyltransferase / wax synthase
VAMMAILVSRAGVCTVTVRYDTASFSAADQLEKGLQLGFDEVLELGRPQRRPTPRRASGGTRRASAGSKQASGGRRTPAAPRRPAGEQTS